MILCTVHASVKTVVCLAIEPPKDQPPISTTFISQFVEIVVTNIHNNFILIS